jgi:hypothetical protein
MVLIGASVAVPVVASRVLAALDESVGKVEEAPTTSAVSPSPLRAKPHRGAAHEYASIPAIQGPLRIANTRQPQQARQCQSRPCCIADTSPVNVELRSRLGMAASLRVRWTRASRRCARRWSPPRDCGTASFALGRREIERVLTVQMPLLRGMERALPESVASEMLASPDFGDITLS